MSTKYIASNWRLPNKAGVDSYLNDNYGLTFDGSEYIDLGTSVDLGTNSTISFWFKSSSGNPNNTIIGEDTYTFDYLLQIVSASNEANIRIGGALETYTGITEINDGNWNHWVIVRSGDSLELFINNTSKGIKTGYGTGTNTKFNKIGAEGDNQFPISGEISEVAVFDYALSSTQISTLYGSSSLGAGNPMALKPAPVAYYNLADNSSGNPLTQPNEAVEDASVFDFDGSSQIINLGNDASLYPQTGDMSYSFWVNPDLLSGYQTIYGLVGMGTSAKGVNIELFGSEVRVFMGVGVGGQWGVNTGGGTGGASLTTSSSGLTVGQWTHVAVTLDRDGNGVIYINGVPNVTAAMNPNDYSAVDIVSSSNILIGNGNGYLNGKTSNLQVWNFNLSASEITTLYNSGVPLTGTQPQEANLKAWYKLDQSANWEADSSGAWQIPDAVSAYPQSFDFEPSETITIANPFTSIVTGSNVIGICTISYWLKVAGGSQQSFMELVNSATHTAGFRIDNNNKPYYINSQGGRYKRFAALSNPSGWNHWCWIFPSNTSYADAKLYINGVEKSVDFDFSAAPANNAWNGFYINKFQTGSSATFKMSNLQLWSGNLTEPQITELYNNGVPLTTAIASDNLKLWSKLDNTATFSTNWSIPDASGNGNTGTSSGMTEQNLVNNNVSALNGESNGMTSASLVLSDLTRNLPYDSYSFSFDSASSDYIDCGTGLGNSLGTVSSLAVSLWFKVPTTAVNDFVFYIGDFSNSYGALAFHITNNRLFIRLNNDGGRFFLDPFTSTDWNNIVFTYDGSSQSNSVLYINGQDQSATFSGSFPSSLNLSGLKTIIGAGYSTSYSFDGKISNISLFNETLTSTEVMKLYSNGVPQDLANFTPSPVAWYPLGSNSFWNGSQWTVRDMIGSNDGTGQNIGVDGLVGDAPRSEANGTGTNNSIPENLVGTTKYSSNNSWSINMSSTARVEDTP